MQRKHILMLSRENLVTHTNDKRVTLVVEPPASMVRIGGGLFQDGVCGDHLPRDQVRPDAEMFQRALRLRSPKLASRDHHLAQRIFFYPTLDVAHGPVPPFVCAFRRERSLRLTDGSIPDQRIAR